MAKKLASAERRPADGCGLDEAQELSDLIHRIYAAALDPARWADVCKRVADFVGGPAAGLLTRDVLSKYVATCVDVEPRSITFALETHSSFDPVGSSVREIVSTSALVPYDEFRQRRVNQDWKGAQSPRDIASAELEKPLTAHPGSGVVHGKSPGNLSNGMARRMALVMPHVHRAVLTRGAIERRSAEAATLADVTDCVGVGIFLLDATAQILHANATGQALLCAGEVLRATRGRLVAVDSLADRTLRKIFAAARDADDEERATETVAVPLVATDGGRYVGHLLPLTARNRTGVMYNAVAALFVRKATFTTPCSPEVIAKTHDLTPTELRVLLAIVDIGGVPEVAATLGIAESTVKTHLGRLFDKTGTNRQADLVKLVAGFSSPTAG
jgi:DNA-binding CsgD family transcriptional regulator